MQFTIIEPEAVHTLEATLTNGRVCVSNDALEQSLGWRRKPEGLCRGDVCIPVRDPATLESDAGLDLAAVCDAIRRPLAIDIDERAAFVGVGADDRAGQLESLVAPDFTLPDLNGNLHSLREYRGKKVFLVAWASW